MTSKVIGSIVALVLGCSAATAADIRRVVTALDANDKAIALFDSRVVPSFNTIRAGELRRPAF